MQAFLEKVAEEILQSHESLENICVVLPGKRSGLFLKKHLSKISQKVLWAPQILTLGEFVEELTQEKSAESLSLMFELYEAYLQLNIAEAEKDSFDDFLSWGSTVLSDFVEIDNYRLDAKKVYADLRNIKEIEGWSLSEPELTENQEEYLEFWRLQGSLHEAFQARMQEKKLSYPAKMIRNLVEEQPEKIKDCTYDHVYLAGFNALTACESALIKVLKEESKGTIFFDADDYYLKNTDHEAGLFMRRHQKNLEDFKWTSNFFEEAKQIDIYGVSTNVEQCKVAGEILSKVNTQNQFENTALVLADENLLLPMLHSLPQEVNSVNVTMGLPLSSTPLAGLWDLLFTLHQKKRSRGFYYKDFKAFIAHPYFDKVLNRYEIDAYAIHQKIAEENQVYIDLDYLKAIELPEAFFPIFHHWKQIPKDIFTSMTTLLEMLQQEFLREQQSIEVEYCFEFSKLINLLMTQFETYQHELSIPSFRKIFRQFISNGSLSFFGEPLSGLQLMGMLETRALDFETLIILSVNENVLPKPKMENSYLPFELKKLYQLPTYQEKDAVFAYHFYRLIQRCKNVHLIYNANTDAFGQGEQSRFLSQLEYELPRYSPNSVIKRHNITQPIDTDKQEIEKITRNESIQTSIQKMIAYGFSPTSISTYLTCPMNFFYCYILGLSEDREVEETVEAKSLGSIVHDTLEELYAPYVGKEINTEALKSIITQSTKKLAEKFKRYEPNRDFNRGQNKLLFTATQHALKKFLTDEQQTIQTQSLKILELEERMETTLNVEGINLKLLGKADRVDELNGKIRLIDYKTGLLSDYELKITSVEELFSGKKSKALQLMTYAYLYWKKHPSYLQRMTPGIISLKQLGKGFIPLTFKEYEELSTPVMEEFETLLLQHLSEIINTEAYEHNEDAKYCRFCGITD